METGVASFGQGQFGIITREDLALLLAWSIELGRKNDTYGYKIRSLTRRIAPVLEPTDLIMLAELADSNLGAEWEMLAADLRVLANRPLFKQ